MANDKAILDGGDLARSPHDSIRAIDPALFQNTPSDDARNSIAEQVADLSPDGADSLENAVVGNTSKDSEIASEVGLGKMVDRQRASVDRLAAWLGVRSDQTDVVLAQVAAEIERRLPEICVGTALVVLSPAVATWASRRFRSKLPLQEADDLGDEVALKVVQAATGQGPRKNALGWLNTTAANALADHVGRRERERKHLGQRRDAGVIDFQPDHRSSE